MNIRRMMLLLAVMVMLLLPVAWLTAPAWLSRAAEYALAQQLCSEVDVAVSSVGWHQSRIKRLYCKDKNNAFEIKLTNAEISYSLQSLLEKRIEDVQLDSLVVQLRTAATVDTQPEVLPVLTTPALLLASLPFSGFDIQHIAVQRQNSAGAVLQALNGYAHYSDQGLRLELSEDTHLKGVQLQINMDKKNGVTAGLYAGKVAIVEVESTLHQTSDGFFIDGTSDIQLAALSTLLKTWVKLPDQQMDGVLRGSWQLALPAQTSSTKKPLWQQIDVSTAMQLDFLLHRPDWGVARGKVHIDMTLKQGLLGWAVADSSELAFGEKQPTSVDLSGLSGSLEPTASGWRAVIAENSVVRVKHLQTNGMLIPFINIQTGSPIAIATTQNGDIKLVKKTLVTAVLPTLHRQGNSFASRNLSITMHRGPLLTPSGNFMVNGLKLVTDNIAFPESRMSGTYQLMAQRLSMAGELNSQASGMHLDWKLNHHMRKQKGMLHFSMKPLAFGAGGLETGSLVRHLEDAAIDSGSLDLHGMVEWGSSGHDKVAGLRSQCILNLSGLQGHYQKNVFSDLSGQILLRSDAHSLIMAPSRLTIGSISSVVPVTRIKMWAGFHYPLDGLPSVTVDGLQAKALGGSISSDHIAVDLARASNPFTVQLEHIDAEQLAKIRQQQGLLVQGYLNGTLPFNWTRDGLKMTAGELHATPAGGLIRYLAKESVRNLAVRGKATQMVLDILSDFHYKQMNVGADYQPDGVLGLRIHLKGNNPAYERGRSVAFNFNIEENILQLLQGLRMSGRLSKALEKKVQKTLQKE